VKYSDAWHENTIDSESLCHLPLFEGIEIREFVAVSQDGKLSVELGDLMLILIQQILRDARHHILQEPGDVLDTRLCRRSKMRTTPFMAPRFS